ncbi:RNA polymerase B [Mycoemilia scoparia]|uniref:RNA polymerase B n=1 Tax=Mycoemilia scoparia TaxID=417184 RepID=A0A9W8A672_9FUNG|nr:RNA polymerase B [Mycoemilia scoparia]
MSSFMPPGTLAEEENASKLQLGPDFNNEECLLISELKILLEAQIESKTREESRMNPVYQKTLSYVQQFSRFTNTDTIREIRNLYQKDNLANFEIAQLCNLCCSDPEEAKALIPSLATKISDEDLDYLLKQMDNLKKFQS